MRSLDQITMLAALTIAAACSSLPGNNGDDDDVATTTPPPTPTGTPQFTADIVPLFEASCGTGNDACHSRVAYGANSGQSCRGWLTLENAMLGAEYYSGPNIGSSTGCPDKSLHDRLLQIDAWMCETLTAYVEPGDAAASYLYRKISGGPYCEIQPGDLSDPMPPTGPLSAGQIEMVRLWIEAGALP